MGSFSFMYADGGKENQANMVPGDRVRLLVPEVFGGGSLDGMYADYGEIASCATRLSVGRAFVRRK